MRRGVTPRARPWQCMAFGVQLLGGILALGPAALAQKPANDTLALVKPPAPFQRELIGDQRPHLPGLEQVRCVETERGWVVSNDQVRTNELIAAWRIAAAKFEKVFRKPVPRGMVFLHVGEGAEALTAAQQLGAQWVQPVYVTPGDIDSGDSVALMESHANWEQSTRAALQQRWPKLTDVQLRDTIAQLWTDRVQSVLHDDSFLAHEATHQWVEQSYSWSPRERDRWLNEGIAVLMETPLAQRDRLAELARYYRQDTSYILPLETLFASAHPVNSGLSYEQTRAWYAQNFAVIEFLNERTQDSTVAGAILAREALGASMEDWLQADGPRYGLPTTVSGLEREWRQWFAQMLAKY